MKNVPTRDFQFNVLRDGQTTLFGIIYYLRVIFIF